MLSPLIPIDCLVYLSGLLHLSRYVTMTSNETCHSKAMDSFHKVHYTHAGCYARDIFSCTYTHTSYYARDIFFYARDIFSCTYTHTSCYATDVFLLHIHTYFLRRYIHLFLHLPTYLKLRPIDIFSCTYTRTKKRRDLKKRCPVKPNGTVQWVFKVPGIFKVQI